MKVLVTGAAGQVGCRLVRQLLDQNCEVRGTILPDDPARSRLDGVDIELREGDLTDLSYVKDAVEGVDAVIHTANLVGPILSLITRSISRLHVRVRALLTGLNAMFIPVLRAFFPIMAKMSRVRITRWMNCIPNARMASILCPNISAR